MLPWDISFNSRCWAQYWKMQKLWLGFTAEALDLWISSASVVAQAATDAEARNNSPPYCPKCGSELQRQPPVSHDYSNDPSVVSLLNRINK